jgi:four helix bundle protein
MLRIYPVILQLVSDLRPVLEQIEQRDTNLGKQARAALTSVPLDTQEASGSTKGTRRARYQSAYGSAREVSAVLDAAVALGYLEHIEPPVAQGLCHVICTLRKLAR